ncbi:MAG: hypothetical protein AAFZ11_10765 [Pseudomonadota bacterium]
MFARQSLYFKAFLGQKPMIVLIDNGDNRDRAGEQVAGEPRDLLEDLRLLDPIKREVLQTGDARSFLHG